MKVRLSHLFSGLALWILLSSCYYNRKLVYFQDKELSKNQATLIESHKEEYHLQPSDVVSVHIKSSGEQGVNNVFNMGAVQGQLYASPGNLYLEGYSIDAEGKIGLPILGELKIVNLTLEEAQSLIQKEAGKYLNNPIAIVKLTSFKVTILGDVKNPGYYYAYNNQLTLLEGLGLAGDLNPTGNRKNVKLIRQTPSGSQVVLLDLTDTSLLKSEFYFMTPGDVIYVEPLKARSKRSNLEVLGVVFAGITTAILILNYVNTH